MDAFRAALADDDLLVRVGSGVKVHVFRAHRRLAGVVDRLTGGDEVRAVALCGTKGEMASTTDDETTDRDELCGTCVRLVGETSRRRGWRDRSAVG